MQTTISPVDTIGHIAAEQPLATRVFARYQIDYCCGGGRPLAEVCETKGLDVDRVRAEIARELTSAPVDERRWLDAPLTELVDYIEQTYHAALRQELPRLDAMARKVLRVHGDKDPERLSALVEVFAGLHAELESHLDKEEQVLFPMIRASHRAPDGPFAVMLHEHDEAGEALRRLRALTDGYRVPDAACNTWRALWHGLEALEQSLHEHIHLENNILFPRALAS